MESTSKLKPGYKNLYDFCVSKEEYKYLVVLSTGMNDREWITKKYEDPKNPGQFIVYKTLSTDIGDYNRFYLQLFRELDITNRARHPCTIELISYDLSELSKPVIVNRFYEHGPLYDLVGEYDKRGNFSFKSKYTELGGMKVHPDGSRTKDSIIEVNEGTVYTNLFYGIARGLKYLHKLKILHRDLKPANILIDENYRPHIADFGFSKMTDGNQEMTGPMGTPLFMAPECIDSVNYSFPADIYSLGVTFYILTELELFLPKAKASVTKRFKMYRAKMQKGISLNPEMRESNKLSELIKRMTLIDPKQRPKIDEVCQYLENEDHWFPNTNKEEFIKYKKEIDDFETVQLPLINDNIIAIPNELSNLIKQMDILKKTNDKGKLLFQDTKYRDIQILLRGCSESNNEAECALGFIFYTGYLGIPKDYVTACRYFKKSKQQGNIQAKSFIMAILNEIVKNERQIDNKYFNKIACNIQDENDPIFNKILNRRSQLLYGMIKESENKYEEAINLYIKSYQKGCNEAGSRLGSLLFKTNNRLDLSEKLLEKTSQWKRKQETCKIKYFIEDNERKLSLLNLGLLKKQKGEIEESIEIFEELLKEDHPDAALLIGQCYEKLKNIDKAKEYYTKSYNEFSNTSAKLLLDYHNKH